MYHPLSVTVYTFPFGVILWRGNTQLTDSAEVAHNIIHAILNRSNTKHIQVYYHFGLIEADPDDNKFVDCAIASGAEFIVTNDAHFDILKTIPWPKVSIVKIEDFVKELR